MYPLVTIILARLLLKERLNRIQALGIALALAAIYLFSAQQSSHAVSRLARSVFLVDGYMPC